MGLLLLKTLALAGLAAALPPLPNEHAKYARWMTNELKYGFISTISTQPGLEGTPFGNVVSYGDGGSGVPYMCVSPLDASVQDLAKNPKFSMTISNAQLDETATNLMCSEGKFGDPENPPCSRLTLSGTFVNVTASRPGGEWAIAKAALNATHPAMNSWGCFDGKSGDHDFFLAKLDVTQAWLIDIFGGAATIPAKEYFAAKP